MGRHSTFTQAIADEICERLSKGEPLAQICRDDHMPIDCTVRNWMSANPAFDIAIADARARGFDFIAADCLQIADDSRNDYIEKLAQGGDEDAVKARAFDAEHVQRAKLRIETRLKLLAKWDPKRYGEKQTIDLNDITPRSQDDVDTKLKAILAKLNADKPDAEANSEG